MTELKRLWQELLEKSDRTSPAEYPDMALITFDEFTALASLGMRPVAWMNAEQLEEYRKGTPYGIGWASPEKSDFYSVPLYDHREIQVPASGKAGALVVEDQNASANEAPATLHIVAVLRAMADNYADGHAWSEVDAYQVRAAADIIERLRQP